MLKPRRFVLILLIGVVSTALSLSVFVYNPQARSNAQFFLASVGVNLSVTPFFQSSDSETETFPFRNLPAPTFVSSGDTLTDANLRFNLPASFSAPVTFEGEITAPNVLYDLSAGDGIALSGDPQNPVISNTGVLSLGGLSGEIELRAGNNIQISQSEDVISISANVQRLGEADIEAFIFDTDNTGTLSSGGLNLSTLSYVGVLPTQVLSGSYRGINQVGTLNGLSVSGLTLLQSIVFTKESPPSGTVGQVYFDQSDENLYLFTNSGWVDLTAGGISYTADGQGIELVGTQFQLELDGASLSKSAQGIKISDTYPGQSSITTVGNLTAGTINYQSLSFSGTLPSANVLGQYSGITGVGNLNGLTVSGITEVDEILFNPQSVPSGTVGQVYFDQSDENLYLFTNSGWVDLTAGGISYTADGQGIELVGTQFQLELDGASLSKSAQGIKISDTYPGQSSITTVGNLTAGTINYQSLSFSGTLPSANVLGQYSGITGVGTITSGSWQSSEIADIYIADNLTISSSGSVADGALSVNVSLLGQSIDSSEIEQNTILPSNLNKTGSAPQNSNLLSYDSSSSTFKWTSLETLGGINYWIKNNNVLSPLEVGNVLSISSGTGVPLTLINSGTEASFMVFDTQNDSTPFVIDKDGRVGIGISSPSMNLDVAGVIGINSVQVAYLPDQNSFAGSLFLGNGGQLLSNNTGDQGRFNTAVGVNAGISLTTGQSNVLMGNASGLALTNGQSNIYMGVRSAFQATTALNNVAVGFEADMNNQQGSNNVILGFRAGYGGGVVHSKSGSVFIGHQAGYQERNSDRLYIDNSATNQPLIWGDFSRDILSVNGSLGIGTGAVQPGSKLTINGLASGVGTAVVIDSSGNFWKDSSSIRYKTNIAPLLSDFKKILELSPVKYDFISSNATTVGYIAEEIESLGLTDLVVYDSLGMPDGVRYDRVPLYLLEIAKDQNFQLNSLKDSIAQIIETDIIQSEMPSPQLQDEMVSQLDIIAIEQSKITHETAFLLSQYENLQKEIEGLKTSAFEATSSALLDMTQVELDKLTVLGETNLYDLKISGNISAGVVTVDSLTGAINTLATPLKLQSEKMADVYIMGEDVKITSQGDIEIKGQVQAEKIVIEKSNEQSASAGEATVPATFDRVLIKTTSVKSESLIYVTFTSNYRPATRFWIEDRIEGESFVLRLDRDVEQDSNFSWWIIN